MEESCGDDLKKENPYIWGSLWFLYIIYKVLPAKIIKKAVRPHGEVVKKTKTL